jgi:hypothetical protein
LALIGVSNTGIVLQDTTVKLPKHLIKKGIKFAALFHLFDQQLPTLSPAPFLKRWAAVGQRRKLPSRQHYGIGCQVNSQRNFSPVDLSIHPCLPGVVMKTVLVIEDEAQTRNIFLQCLSLKGFGPMVPVMGMKAFNSRSNIIRIWSFATL